MFPNGDWRKYNYSGREIRCCPKTLLRINKNTDLSERHSQIILTYSNYLNNKNLISSTRYIKRQFPVYIHRKIYILKKSNCQGKRHLYCCFDLNGHFWNRVNRDSEKSNIMRLLQAKIGKIKVKVRLQTNKLMNKF